MNPPRPPAAPHSAGITTVILPSRALAHLPSACSAVPVLSATAAKAGKAADGSKMRNRVPSKALGQLPSSPTTSAPAAALAKSDVDAPRIIPQLMDVALGEDSAGKPFHTVTGTQLRLTPHCTS
jgi:hypothetical protein